MPVTLRLTFPAGRYHATPWGRHVNEGVPEWPPSPWRLLRALVAVWRRTRPELPETQARRILGALLAPPLFRLPDSRVAHTRHYMPLGKKSPVEIVGGGTTRVFDTFVAVDRSDPLFVVWPEAELSPEDREALRVLLGNMTFLGRAESWVQAEPWDGSVVANCRPAEGSDPNPVPVLCADPATVFGDEFYPTPDPKMIRRGLRPAERLFDCPPWHLCMDTQTLHERRWPALPGSRWVHYSRPGERALSRPSARSGRPAPTVARYALDAPTLPRVTDTLPLAEALRARLLSACASLHALAGPGREAVDLHEVAPALWGKDRDGTPLTGHQHAFILPVDEDTDGRLDHVVLFVPMGFGPTEARALDRTRRLRLGEGELVLALVGLGAREDFAGSRLLGVSATWESVTPFVVTRHRKSRGRRRDPRECFEGPDALTRFVERVIREELARRAALDDEDPGRFAGVEVKPLPDRTDSAARPRVHEYQLRRRKRNDDDPTRPRGRFRLQFPRPVPGPIALGHSCHFGLGLFRRSS